MKFPSDYFTSRGLLFIWTKLIAVVGYFLHSASGIGFEKCFPKSVTIISSVVWPTKLLFPISSTYFAARASTKVTKADFFDQAWNVSTELNYLQYT